MKKIFVTVIGITLIMVSACSLLGNQETSRKGKNLGEKEMVYTMPEEDSPHEGTWLIWPHAYTYGAKYQKEIEEIWVQMTQALHQGEKVHIVAYDKKAVAEIEKKLEARDVDMEQVDFVLAKSNDVWVRDTGPIFVVDQNNQLTIADFAFDGWGEKMDFQYDDKIPVAVSKEKKVPKVDISDFVLEGGSVEVDGQGTLMATLSSVVSENRNKSLTVKQAETYLSKYLGVKNFIWLEGVIDEDITDAHIDGMARFLDDRTILTVSKQDFLDLYETIDLQDYETLQNAKNAKGESYAIVELPLTKKKVSGLDYKGSYLNYYIGNRVILMPTYQDENDAVAQEIIADLYPDRKIVPIVVNELFQYGGMLHCVTQQQPEMK